MTKHYFISYISCDGNATTYGHCMMQVCNLDLTGISREIQKVNNFNTLPTILCLKDLSKKEYEMLSGGKKMKPQQIVTEQEREVCRLAPKSLAADIVRFRLAMQKFRREIKRVIDNHVKLD